MPSERFFYRPVDPGYAQMGASLASGILGGVDTYYDEKDRIAQRKRQEEEDERRRRFEDAEDARRQAEYEASIIERGGGMGPKPVTPGTPELEFGQPGLARRSGPGNALTGPIDLDPGESLRPKPPGMVARAAADPEFGRYREIGPPGFAYIQTPEYTRRQAIEEERGYQDEQERLARTRIAQALIGRHPELSQADAEGMAEGLGMGLWDYDDLYPTQDKPWQPTTKEEAEEWYKFEQQNRRFQPLSGGTTRALTPNQAAELITRMYPGEFEGDTSLDPDEFARLVQEWSSGQVPDFPEVPATAPGQADTTAVGREIPEIDLPPIQVPPPAARRMPPNMVAAIREALSVAGVPQDEWATVLSEEGYTPSEIADIIGR